MVRSLLLNGRYVLDRKGFIAESNGNGDRAVCIEIAKWNQCTQALW
jgi:hypothetical protein